MLDILAYIPIVIFFFALYAGVFWAIPMELNKLSGEERDWSVVVMMHIAAGLILWMAWGISRLSG